MTGITLRVCTEQDERSLRRLAELDDAAYLTGRVLGAEQEGELRAAIALEGGLVIADPFRSTAHLVELLRTRAAQIERQEEACGARRGTRPWRLRGRWIGRVERLGNRRVPRRALP